MDIVGGSGICRGPSNLVAAGYMNIPIAVTVEGANILTRTLITFGQGLLRAHPNLLNIVNALEAGDQPDQFADDASALIRHFASNAVNSISRGVLRSRSRSRRGLLPYFESQWSRMAANFAASSDLALALGGKLKTEEMLSGRYADALGTLYLGYSCMWWYKQNSHIDGIDTVFELAMDTLLYENQVALEGISKNFPVLGVGCLAHWLCFPLGKSYSPPTDELRKRAANLITTPSGVRELLCDGVFVSEDPSDQLRKLVDVFSNAVAIDEVVLRARKAERALTTAEQEEADRVAGIVDELIQVDSFDKVGVEKYRDSAYVRPALAISKFANLGKSKNRKH